MNDKLDKEQLSNELDKLAKSSVSKIVIQFLEQKVDELDTVKGAESVKEILGRQNAIKKLKEIINRLEPKEDVGLKNEYK